MGDKYNFKFNPERLSSEKIEQYQDFDALLEKHRRGQSSESARTAKIRRLTYIGSAIAAGVAVLWLAVFVNPSTPRADHSAIAEAYFANQEYVHPPLENIRPAFANFEINAQSGGEILYASGSKLVIPRQAFMNNRGENVKGEVDIRFRELIDYVDFFLAGIPMTYDSAGTRYHLESAGMLEIYAEQDGQAVQLAPGKTIDVVLFSEILVSNLKEKPSFNVYKLDTTARNWVYSSPDQIDFLEDFSYDQDDPLAAPKETLINQLNNIEQKKRAALTELEASIPQPDRPLRPFPNDPNIPTFELDFPAGVTDSGVAALYAGTVWQLSPNNAPFDQELLAFAWDVENIEKINNQEYEIVLTKPDYTLRILAAPTLIGEDYQNALASYEQDLQLYENATTERENKLQAQRDAIHTWASDERQIAMAKYETDLKNSSFVNASPSSMFRRKVINRFTVHSLGLWNCDRPIQPEKEAILATLKDQKGNTYQNVTAFVVDKTHNTIYRYYAADGHPLELEKEAENLIWVITEDQKVAVLRTEKPSEAGGEMVMTLVDKAIESEEDVRRILAF